VSGHEGRDTCDAERLEDRVADDADQDDDAHMFPTQPLPEDDRVLRPDRNDQTQTEAQGGQEGGEIGRHVVHVRDP
jgi:hypothetical protein